MRIIASDFLSSGLEYALVRSYSKIANVNESFRTFNQATLGHQENGTPLDTASVKHYKVVQGDARQSGTLSHP